MTQWLSQKPLLLASKSQARQNLLHACHIRFEVCPADLDERALEQQNKHINERDMALLLARAKAQAVSRLYPDHFILAADQILVLEDKRLHQCTDRNHAIAQLQSLSGKTHRLISAVVLIDDNKQSHEWVDIAEMQMRDLSRVEIEAYLDEEGSAVLKSVGCYHYESKGEMLFSKVTGSIPTIMGMPIDGLVRHLITKGLLSA